MAHAPGHPGIRGHGTGALDADTGGNSMTMNSGTETDDDAWLEFYDWASEQCWGPDCSTTGAEQFQAYVQELEALGLPVEGLHTP